MGVRGGRWAWLGGLLARAWRGLLERISPRRGAARGRVTTPAIELERVAASGPALLAREPRSADPLPPLDPSLEQSLQWGDFAGADEAERFAALPPIAPDALDDVDWDALARDLTRRA